MSERAKAQQQKTVIPDSASLIGGILQRTCACGQHTVTSVECAECRKKRLQRKAAGHSDPETAPSIVHEVLRSPGQPLDAETRAYMEPRFGHNFRHIRLHTNAQAAESAQAVEALAYTVGQDVVFDAGQYAPATRAGRQLLAHELTHTIQQGPGTVSTAQGLPLGPNDSVEEHMAEANARAVSGGKPSWAGGALGAYGKVVRRQRAPIESEQSESTDLQVNLQEIRGSLDLLRGRHRFGAEARLTSPAGAALDLLRVDHPLDPPRVDGILRYDSRCNSAFQSALLGLEANPFVTVGQVPWQINTQVGVRVGSLRFEPGVGVSFLGDQFDRLVFTLNLAAASTTIPPECIAPPITPAPPPRRTEPPSTGEPPRRETPSTASSRLPAYTLHFFYDSTLMRPEDHEQFQRVIDLLQMVPSLQVQLTGHASLEGTGAYNQRLSEQRAQAVRDRLVLAGIPESRIHAQGLGETAPAVREPDIPRRSLDPSVEQIRTLNRRVEITFFDPTGRFESRLPSLGPASSSFSLGVPPLRLGQ